jgi:hypothetical protein
LIYEGWAFCRRLEARGVAVPGLRPSWFGLRVDLSDPQWRDFRGSMGLLVAIFTGFVALSRSVSTKIAGAGAPALGCGLRPQPLSAWERAC